MPRKIDLTGQVFGRLTVLEEAPKLGREVAWRCLCTCGNETVARRGHLTSSVVRSCGCLNREVAADKGRRNATHGMSQTPAWFTWAGMVDRCTAPGHAKYPSYGGRGITVCPEWLESFEAFHRDMGDRPDGLSLDRIDNNGPYSPDNCRWATPSQQARNRRDNRRIAFQGEEKTLAEWAEVTGLSPTTIGDRIKRGWPTERALSTPAAVRRQH